MEPYEIERIATVLAVTCMFLAALYSIFAVLLFLYIGQRERGDFLEDDDVVSGGSGGRGGKPTIISDPRRENFITISDT